MKKIISTVAVTLSVCGFTGATAHAGDAGFHANQEAGVKVYRGNATHLNYQAVTALQSVRIAEKRVDNQNRQANAKLNAEKNIAQQRLDLDRRIAFTDNEIFSQNRSRFGGQRFVSGQSNRGFNGRSNNRFYGVNGISHNSRFSGGLKGKRFK